MEGLFGGDHRSLSDRLELLAARISQRSTDDRGPQRATSPSPPRQPPSSLAPGARCGSGDLARPASNHDRRAAAPQRAARRFFHFGGLSVEAATGINLSRHTEGIHGIRTAGDLLPSRPALLRLM